MYDIVPDVILERIARQYERAVDRARERYPRWRADEDFSSGALGGTMEEVVKGTRQIDGDVFKWRTNTWSVRGKGGKNPETEYGADAVVEIELRNESDHVLARKGLPFQSKKERVYSNAKLAEQAGRLARLPGGGLVVSFSEDGFTSCDAGVVAEAAGRWTQIPDQLKSSFGRALGRDFLRCRIGSRDTYYDARREVFRSSDGSEIRLPVRRRIRTLIRRQRVTKRRLKLKGSPRE